MEIQRNLGIELRSRGMPHRKWISYNLWDPREFRYRIEVQGDAPQEMDFL